jgi:hypothetical protein
VGGSGTWDASTTTNWATTSGGAGGASAPTSADNAYFDGSSDSGAPFTVTIGTGAVCADVIIGDGVTVTTLDQTMTLAGTAPWDIYGSLYFPATNLTRTYTGNPISFLAATTGKTITTNGVAFSGGDLRFNNVSGGWTLGSALSTGSGSLNLLNGSLDTASYNITTNELRVADTNGSPTLTAGTSTITITVNNGAQGVRILGTGAPTLNTSSANFVHTAGTSRFQSNHNITVNSISFTTSSTTQSIISGATITVGTFYRAPLNTTGVGSISVETTGLVVTSALHIQSGYGATFDITDTAGAITAATVNAGGTGYNVGDVINVTGGNNDAQLTVATLSGTAIATVTISTPGTGYTTATGVATTLATSALNTNRRILINSSATGTARTITAAAVNITNTDFRDITGAGAATWNDSSRTRYWGNALGNSGITFSAGVSKYRIGTGNWSDTQWASTSGGSPAVGDFPLAQDTCVFDANTTTGTHTINFSYPIGSLSMSAVTSAVTLATGAIGHVIYGNVTLDADVTLSGTGTITFAGQGTTQTITSAGRSFTQPITVNSPTGTVVIADNFVTAGQFALISGTLDLNNQNLTCGTFNSNFTSRTIDFKTSSKILVSGNNGTIVTLNNGIGLTILGTFVVDLTYSGSTGTRAIGGGPSTDAAAMNINVLSGSDNIELTQSHYGSVNFTGFSGQWAIGSTTNYFYGNLVISTGMTISSGTGTKIFARSSGSQSVTTDGKTFNFPIIKQAAGTLTLADDLTMGSTRTFTLTQGTLALNGKTLTTGLFSSSNSNVREINFGSSGELRVLEGGTSFNAGTSTNLTTSGTGTINMVSAAGKTFAGGGRTYPTLNQGGTSALAITGANTFADITNVADGYADTQRYNLLTYTEQFDNATWGKFGVDVTANTTATTDPLGGNTADLVYPLTTGSLRRVQQATTVTIASSYTQSVYAKAAGFNWLAFRFDGSPLSFKSAWFNLATGQKGTVDSGITADIEPVGNGWYRCTITGTSVSSGSSTTYIGPVDADNSLTTTVNGTDGIYIWGAQLVTGPYPGVYQKVEAASVFTPQVDAFPVAITFPSGVTTSVQDFSVGGTLGNLVTLNASTPGSRAILNRV